MKQKKERKIWIVVTVILLILLLFCYSQNGFPTAEGFSILYFGTSFENMKDSCTMSCEGWDTGYATKTEGVCEKEGDIFENFLITEIDYIYDDINEIPCCCYNIKTCEDFGYFSGTSDEMDSIMDSIVVSGLSCWEPKEVIETKFVCCETYNLGKFGEKIDIIFGWMTNSECNEMTSIFDGSGVVLDSYCE